MTLQHYLNWGSCPFSSITRCGLVPGMEPNLWLEAVSGEGFSFESSANNHPGSWEVGASLFSRGYGVEDWVINHEFLSAHPCGARIRLLNVTTKTSVHAMRRFRARVAFHKCLIFRQGSQEHGELHPSIGCKSLSARRFNIGKGCSCVRRPSSERHSTVRFSKSLLTTERMSALVLERNWDRALWHPLQSWTVHQSGQFQNEKVKTREWRDQIHTVLSLNFDIKEDKCFSRRVKEMVDRINDPFKSSFSCKNVWGRVCSSWLWKALKSRNYGCALRRVVLMMSRVQRSYSWNKQVIQGIDLQLVSRLQLILKNCGPWQKIFAAVILFFFLQKPWALFTWV